MKSVILKKGKEGIFTQRHHWIFSGAVMSYPKGYQEGELVSICSHSGEKLGWGFFNTRCSLAGRIVSFGEGDPYIALRRSFERALLLRKRLIDEQKTTAYRLINGEGDGIPGLIIDKYGAYLVIQAGTLGIRLL
ncbi:MAG: class I SAM-dependent rRNA methyltransferase, partial [Chlamydiia bacterium]|nr:class I SAM-dependent rRNA methyltransferase [Chlamydiia bacterium]